jgi:hypothetical protein
MTEPTINKQVCSIRIMFQVDTDEKAFDCKKKIATLFTDNPDVHITFSLMNSAALRERSPNG